MQKKIDGEIGQEFATLGARVAPPSPDSNEAPLSPLNGFNP